MSKLRGENYFHVDGFFNILKDVERKIPGILSDGDRIWNADETNVTCEFAKRIKVFGSSATHHDGFLASSSSSGSGPRRSVSILNGIAHRD